MSKRKVSRKRSRKWTSLKHLAIFAGGGGRYAFGESQFSSQLATDASGMWRKKWFTQEITRVQPATNLATCWKAFGIFSVRACWSVVNWQAFERQHRPQIFCLKCPLLHCRLEANVSHPGSSFWFMFGLSHGLVWFGLSDGRPHNELVFHHRLKVKQTQRRKKEE